MESDNLFERRDSADLLTEYCRFHIRTRPTKNKIEYKKFTGCKFQVPIFNETQTETER